MKHIYMDHNATTPTDPRVVEAMLPHFDRDYGNPSSLHEMGQKVRQAYEGARGDLAKALSCEPERIIFTGGGSESNNIAIKGVAFANRERGKHLITCKVEHHAVLYPLKYLEKHFGFDVTYLDVDRHGVVDPDDVRRSIRDDTILITIMHANNEVGTIEPIEEIARMAAERDVYVHTDAVQTIGKLPVDIEAMGVRLLSLSAHKLYGPKGVGALYVGKGTILHPLVHGGHQERGLRAGTENVPGAIGLAKAAEIATAAMPQERERLTALTRRLETGIVEAIPDVVINGHPGGRIPGTTNASFLFIEGESVVLGLDMEGVAVSTGSACTSEDLSPSHVLTAMGLTPQEAQGSVRFGLGRHTAEADVDHVLSVLPGIVEKLRAISPLKRSS